MAFLSFSNHPTPLTWFRVTWLFPRVKTVLKGKRFEDTEAIQKNVTSTLHTIPKESFKKCFLQWQDCWKQCVSSEGEYFEKY
jgi:hypothetical protein